MESVRLNKFLSFYGICSRREADRLTENGRITVNGIVGEKGMKIADEDIVCIDGKSIEKRAMDRILLLVNNIINYMYIFFFEFFIH